MPLSACYRRTWNKLADEGVRAPHFPTLSLIFVETLCRNFVENGLFRQSFPTKFSTKFLKCAGLGQPLFIYLTSLNSNGANWARYRRHTGQLWFPSVSRNSCRMFFFMSNSSSCRALSINRSSL